MSITNKPELLRLRQSLARLLPCVDRLTPRVAGEKQPLRSDNLWRYDASQPLTVSDSSQREEGLEMTITVLLMTIMTQLQHHTVVAEYNTPEACQVAAQAYQKVLSENNLAVIYSCSPKGGSR
jgi:hypothetical protein